MTKYKIGAFCLLFIGCFLKSHSQSSLPDCSILKNGRFQYIDSPDTTAYIFIQGSDHTEYFDHEKYYIKSKLTWIDNCSYIMVMTEITVKKFPYHPGDKMKVQINNIENGVIYYTSTVKGKSWQGRMKIEEHRLK